MRKKIEKVIEKLTLNNKTISTMESCTGGGASNAITNVPGASSVLKFSAVTYSNEFKIKMGVSSETINEYTVYSKETAREMAKAISDFSSSDFGVGITGKLGIQDPKNPDGDDDLVYLCVYDREKDKYNDLSLRVDKSDRKDDKLEVLEVLFDFLEEYV